MDIVSFRNDKLVLLDQRNIPAAVDYLTFSTHKEAAEAISEMVVRGAPAIGIAAAYAYCLGVHEALDSGLELPAYMAAVKSELLASRPTAVNLKWAIEEMESAYKAVLEQEPSLIYSELLKTADSIKKSEIEANIRIGDFGEEAFLKIREKRGRLNILTHCNAGELATGGWGTALGVIRTLHRSGHVDLVYADETRPRLQGARLTCFELSREGVNYRLICDNTSGLLMMKGEIDAVVVGADRIAANGDVANKVGTYMVSVLADRHSVPFYVAAPVSTFDFNTSRGEAIEIEERSQDEVLEIKGNKIAPEGTEAVNLAFDITPAELITGYITEKGVIKSPDELQ